MSDDSGKSLDQMLANLQAAVEKALKAAQETECNCPKCWPGDFASWTKSRAMDAARVACDHLLGVAAMVGGEEFWDLAVKVAEGAAKLSDAPPDVYKLLVPSLTKKRAQHAKDLAEVRAERWNDDGSKKPASSDEEDDGHG